VLKPRRKKVPKPAPKPALRLVPKLARKLAPKPVLKRLAPKKALKPVRKLAKKPVRKLVLKPALKLVLKKLLLSSLLDSSRITRETEGLRLPFLFLRFVEERTSNPSATSYFLFLHSSFPDFLTLSRFVGGARDETNDFRCRNLGTQEWLSCLDGIGNPF
jgi:hypothetical protein